MAVLVLAAAVCLTVAECRRTSEQDFYSGSSVEPHPGAIQDMPGNEVMPAEPLDRIQVISSAIRVLPRPPKTRARRSPSHKPHHEQDLRHSLPRARVARKLEEDQDEHSGHKAAAGKRHKKKTEGAGHALSKTRGKKPEGVSSHGLSSKSHKKAEGVSSHGLSKSHKKAEGVSSHDLSKSHKKAKGVSSHGLSKIHKKAEAVSSPDWAPAIRRFRREAVNSFRRPRDFQFVTNKMDRLGPPPIVTVYPPGGQRDEREIDRGYRKAQRRIIYYANLPEIVRPPVQWYPANNNNDYFYDSTVRQPYTSASSNIYSPSKSSYPSYPSYSSYSSPSENDITRVQSNIIDVTNSRFPPHYSSTQPKFTIIDVEPPYYNRPPPSRFYDVRTPPYRDYSHFPSQSFQHSELPLEPVKLQTPPSDYSPTSNSTSTDSPANSTRFLPDVLPVNLRSISKFIT